MQHQMESETKHQTPMDVQPRMYEDDADVKSLVIFYSLSSFKRVDLSFVIL